MEINNLNKKRKKTREERKTKRKANYRRVGLLARELKTTGGPCFVQTWAVYVRGRFKLRLIAGK